MTPEFLADLAKHNRPFIGGAYGVYSQQHADIDPEVYFYIQVRETPESRWAPLTGTFDKDSLPVMAQWKEMTDASLPDGWESRIVKVEVSVAEPVRQPAEKK